MYADKTEKKSVKFEQDPVEYGDEEHASPSV